MQLPLPKIYGLSLCSPYLCLLLKLSCCEEIICHLDLLQTYCFSPFVPLWKRWTILVMRGLKHFFLSFVIWLFSLLIVMQGRKQFITLSNKVEKFMHSVCPSVRTLTLVNILQVFWNWYMLFISDIAWTVLKMVYIRLMVCLQRHTKVFRYITVYGEKIFKAYFIIFRLR